MKKRNMQCLSDFVCTECSHEFESAALLLQHFATHVVPKSSTNSNTEISHVSHINVQNSDFQFEDDKSSDSGLEDLNPLKLCLVTIDEDGMYDKDHSLNGIEKRESIPKYQCSFCHKNFGWPTDLKRHILIHTGERPFKCDLCNSTFTRKFILQKHQKKMHLADIKLKIPDLKPIGTIKGKRRTTRFSSYQVI